MNVSRHWLFTLSQGLLTCARILSSLTDHYKATGVEVRSPSGETEKAVPCLRSRSFGVKFMKAELGILVAYSPSRASSIAQIRTGMLQDHLMHSV